MRSRPVWAVDAILPVIFAASLVQPQPIVGAQLILSKHHTNYSSKEVHLLPAARPKLQLTDGTPGRLFHWEYNLQCLLALLHK